MLVPERVGNVQRNSVIDNISKYMTVTELKQKLEEVDLTGILAENQTF